MLREQWTVAALRQRVHQTAGHRLSAAVVVRYWASARGPAGWEGRPAGPTATCRSRRWALVRINLFSTKNAKCSASISDRSSVLDGHCVDQQTVNQISSPREKNGQTGQNASSGGFARLHQASFQCPIGLLESPCVAVQ